MDLKWEGYIGENGWGRGKGEMQLFYYLKTSNN